MCEAVPFSGVPEGLAPALEARGFKALTLVQEAVLDPELAGRDLRISSQTGSGKTVAIGFVLAAELQNVDTSPWPRRTPAQPQVLLIAPTRELAHQIGEELAWLFRPLQVRGAVVTGGTNIGGDFRNLDRGPHVLVGTPGRLLDHVKRGAVNLSKVQAVVLDEADEMLDMGFRDDLEAILDETPKDRHTHMMSATFPREVLALARTYQNSAAHVEGTQAGAANDDITHVAHMVRTNDKVGALINTLLVAPGERTLVFVRTRAATAQLAAELASNGFSASALSGDMGQRERTATLEQFRRGGVQVLVATDVAARGLDISDVAQVVHFDLPDNPAAFTHRSGRTGRAGNKGTSFVLVPPAAIRRAEYVFQRAAVRVEWRKVPTPEKILSDADERFIAKLSAGSAEKEPTRRLRWLAEKLLESSDPGAVIAALLERSDHIGPCAPRMVGSQLPSERKGRDRKPVGGRGPRPGADAGPRRRGGSYTSFHVTFGSLHGANPSRLLAMMCRRGGISGSQVGAIRISDHTSVVDVASAAADGFIRAAAKPDTQNPKVRVRLFDAAAAGAGASQGGGKPLSTGPRNGGRPPGNGAGHRGGQKGRSAAPWKGGKRSPNKFAQRKPRS